jgi:hypothetical protein
VPLGEWFTAFWRLMLFKMSGTTHPVTQCDILKH